MLRVTVDLVPNGNEAMKRTLAVLQVTNIGGNADVASYSVAKMYAADAGKSAVKKVRDIQRFKDVFIFLREILVGLGEQ